MIDVLTVFRSEGERNYVTCGGREASFFFGAGSKMWLLKVRKELTGDGKI